MISVSPTLTTEMNSLIRHPAAALTVEKFLPTWTEEIAHASDDYANGHSACVAVDGAGAGEDIVFRARSNAGTLEVAAISGASLLAISTWEGLFGATAIAGLMNPAWSANSGAAYGGALVCVWDSANTKFVVFATHADGTVQTHDFSYVGNHTASLTVVSGLGLDSMQVASCTPSECYILQNELVEPSQDTWQQNVYGANIRRFTLSGTWSEDTNAFMFHTHALGHLATDGPKPNDGSTGVEAQWGVRPCGGLSVSEIDTNTTLISVGIRFYYRKSYYTHTQAVMGFLYHRDNGIWERVFDNDEADFDSDNQLWLDAFARNSLVDNRNFVSWVRFSEPSNFEQISGSLSLPRSVEAVYARVSSDGRYLTQFQYIGDPVGLCASTLIAATTTGTKILCAVGHSQVLSSPPAHFVCDVPDSYKVDMEMFTSGYVVDKGNQWNFAIASNLEAGAVRFTEELREGDLIRAYQGIEGELMQIGQAYIDTTAPAISLMARQHKGPLQARAELMLYGTKAEVIDDIFPMETVTIEPIHPGGPGATIFTEDGEEITVHHPANIALNRGYWALRKTRWPALFFGGIYDYLANKLTYRMSGHMWAFTGGGPVDLPPGVYGGPGSVADEFRTYKRGTFFNDIVWTIVEPRVDGAIQSAVRFGDDRNYGNFTFDALTGCDVEANIIRNNGLITQIEYSSDDCAGGEVWNTVLQESCAAGLICRSVQHDLDEKGTGKKYIFVWEANSDFTTGSHLEDQAGRFWGKLVFDKPDYGSQPIGQNKLYLIISDFDESDENWQTNESWVHKAIQHTDATGLTTGHPADLKMQVLGGTIHCFYRPFPSGSHIKQLWRHAFSHKSGHFGAGRFGLVGRGHATIEWDAFWPGRNHIDQVDNVVDFWDIEVTDCVRDTTLEEVITKYAWQGLTETEYRSHVNDSGRTVNANTIYNGYGFAVENPCIDFTVTCAADGGEAGMWFRAIDNADPTQGAIYIGLVFNSTYKQGDNTLNCYVVKRRYTGGSEVVVDSRDYSPSPLHLKPNLPYRVRISVRNDLFNVYVEGNYVGHFHDDTELGPYFGLYTQGQNADFADVRLPELHEIPENALLDPNIAMIDAIRKVIGQRHIKGVFRPQGQALVSYFEDHDSGVTLEDNLRQSGYLQTDRFHSVVEVIGASERAIYTSEKLLDRGRRYGQFNNPNLMTVEACFNEARRLAREKAELMVQAKFESPPDLRLEPEDEVAAIVAQQSVNGNYLISRMLITFNLKERTSSMGLDVRRVYIL